MAPVSPISPISPVSNEELEFATQQYVDLWRDYGIELPAPFRKELLLARLSQQPSRKETSPLSLSTEATPGALSAIQTQLDNCKRCDLCQKRTNIVFGVGNPQAKLMFVGEGPGADEDAQAIPFVGRAGKLLTKIIEAMGYARQDVYIANIVKCRPPGNRAPLPEEVEQCFPFLQAQINSIQPKVIVALGAVASNNLLQTTSSMAAMRSRFHSLTWRDDIAVMPTYHPAYLLRNPNAKRLVWDDMKKVIHQLENSQ